MTIQELLKNTGNVGIRGNHVLTLTNGKRFVTTHIRHPYSDEEVIGFSGADYGEFRVETVKIAAVEDMGLT